MKRYSKWSIGLMIVGLILFGVNREMKGYSELIVILGLLSFIVGIVLTLIAIAKHEEGNLKFISLISFIVVLFLFTWFESFQVIRLFTWLKNIL